VSCIAISPFQGLPPKKDGFGPRPLAWALLVRPFGARFGISSASTPGVQQKVWDTLCPRERVNTQFSTADLLAPVFCYQPSAICYLPSSFCLLISNFCLRPPAHCSPPSPRPVAISSGAQDPTGRRIEFSQLPRLRSSAPARRRVRNRE